MTKVFISYSRKDIDFCVQLAEALNTSGYEPVYDRSQRPHDDPDARLSAQDEWWKQLQTMIAACEVMIFVVTPDSIASSVCDDEIAHALSLGKRIIPLLLRSIDFNAVPVRLCKLNIKLDFRDATDFAVSFSELTAEIAVDIEWHRRCARLARQAQQWESGGRPEGQLLRAGAIDDVDAWASRRPHDAPGLGPLLLEFIDKSRAKERMDSENRCRIIGRAFVKPAVEMARYGYFDAGLRLAAAGLLLSDDLESKLVPELNLAFRQTAFVSRLRGILHGPSAGFFSPDGTRIATTRDEGDHTVRIWDVATCQEVTRLQGHVDWVRMAAFRPDGEQIITASADGTARVWNAYSGAEISCFVGHGARVYTGMFASDGKQAVTASGDGTARIWDVASGMEIACLQGHKGEVTCAKFIRGGTLVLTTSEDCTARIWDVAKKMEIACLQGHEGETLAAISSDESRIVTVAKASIQDRIVRIWDISTGREINKIKSNLGNFSDVAFNPGATCILTLEGSTATIWDVAKCTKLFQLKGHTHLIISAAFSPSGSHIVTASGDKTARIWDAANGAEIGAFKGHEDAILNVAFSPDGRTIVTGSRDQTVRLWDTSTNNLIAMLQSEDDGNVRSIEFSRDGTRILTVGKTTHQWDAETFNEIKCFNQDRNVAAAAISPDGTRVLAIAYTATSRTTSAVLWDAISGGEIVRLTGVASLGDLRNVISQAPFSPDSTHFAIISENNTVLICHCATGVEIACLYGHEDTLHTALFSPDGSQIAAVGSKSVTIWDTSTAEEIARIEESGTVVVATFSPDGGRILVTCQEWASLWDLKKGISIARLDAHGNSEVSALFSPNGTHIVTASDGTGIVVWDGFSGERLVELQDSASGGSISFSADGERVVAVAPSTHGGVAGIWDTRTGALIAFLGTNFGVNDVALSPDGTCLATGSNDSIVRIWDITRSSGLHGTPSVVLAASLTSGIGLRTANEREDLLMQMAPDDLCAALIGRLSEQEHADSQHRAAILMRTLHPHCYLAPSQRPMVVPRNLMTIEEWEEEWLKARSQSSQDNPSMSNEDSQKANTFENGSESITIIDFVDKEDPGKFTAMNDLAAEAQKLGKLDMAHSLLERAFDGILRLLGEEHPDTLMVMFNLAKNEYTRGNYLRFLSLMQSVLDITKRVYGNVSHETLECLHGIVQFLRVCGDHISAAEYYKKAVETLDQLCEPPRD